jgi:ribosomal-protein-alanine N-acetyltransferase
MKNKNILNILNTKNPLDHTNTITFLTLSRSKKFFKGFFKYSKEEKFFEFFERSSIKSQGEFNYYIKKLIKTEKNNHQNDTYEKFWLVVDHTQNKVVGSAKLTNVNPLRRSVEWGYGIDFKVWGTDYILKIQSALIDYIFNKLNFHRLHGATHVNNLRVIKALEKLGFRKEGIKYDYLFDKRKNKFFDALSYSFLKTDYVQRKKFSKITKNLININYSTINRIISNVFNKKFPARINLNMNNISEWDSVSHFDIISKIEKKFGRKFSNQEILTSTSTDNIIKILKTS